MCLQAQEDVVHRADLARVVRGVGPRHEVASRTEHPDSVRTYGPQMLTPGDQMDIGATTVQCRAPVGADRTGSEDCNSHGGSSRFERE